MPRLQRQEGQKRCKRSTIQLGGTTMGFGTRAVKATGRAIMAADRKVASKAPGFKLGGLQQASTVRGGKSNGCRHPARRKTLMRNGSVICTKCGTKWGMD